MAVPNDAVCRICLSSSEDGELISPCSCRGSLQYVHSQCLERWLLLRPLNAQDSEEGDPRALAPRCDLCRTPITITVCRAKVFATLRAATGRCVAERIGTLRAELTTSQGRLRIIGDVAAICSVTCCCISWVTTSEKADAIWMFMACGFATVYMACHILGRRSQAPAEQQEAPGPRQNVLALRDVMVSFSSSVTDVATHVTRVGSQAYLMRYDIVYALVMLLLLTWFCVGASGATPLRPRTVHNAGVLGGWVLPPVLWLHALIVAASVPMANGPPSLRVLQCFYVHTERSLVEDPWLNSSPAFRRLMIGFIGSLYVVVACAFEYCFYFSNVVCILLPVIVIVNLNPTLRGRFVDAARFFCQKLFPSAQLAAKAITHRYYTLLVSLSLVIMTSVTEHGAEERDFSEGSTSSGNHSSINVQAHMDKEERTIFIVASICVTQIVVIHMLQMIRGLWSLFKWRHVVREGHLWGPTLVVGCVFCVPLAWILSLESHAIGLFIFVEVTLWALSLSVLSTAANWHILAAASMRMHLGLGLLSVSDQRREANAPLLG